MNLQLRMNVANNKIKLFALLSLFCALLCANRLFYCAVDQTPLILKEIDINLFLNGNESIRKSIAESVDQELHIIGAFRIINHGLSVDLINDLFQECRAFFDSSNEFKAQYKSSGILGTNGWESIGTANIGATFNSSSTPDAVESLILWFEQLLRIKNQFGEQEIYNYCPPKLCQLIISYCEQSKKIIDVLLEIFTLALSLNVNQFALDMKDTNYLSGFRLWNYLDLNEVDDKYEFRFGEHSDFNLITMVTSDGVDGLQYKLERIDNEWHTLLVARNEVSADSIIVNVGEVIEMYTCGYWLAARHRVEKLSKQRRNSIVYFVGPSLDSMIDEIEECIKCKQNKDDSKMQHFSLPMQFREHARRRFGGSYNHAKVLPFWLE